MKRPLMMLLILLCLPSIGRSQNVPRQRIGLALAGGGAKGLAHIGVLRWMEEHRIPIDAVAGSSMGGMIAGAYATGRSGAEIQQFITQVDWESAMRFEQSYQDLTFRRKEDQRAFPASFEMGLRGGTLHLPAGLNSGHHVGLILDEISSPYGDLSSFDDLPTPFRCVAADLLSGGKIVFKNGSLGDALRATMAYPGMFNPISYDGMVLVDGGVVDNLPADVVREMPVDVVIAVDLGIATVPPDQVASLLDVANRSLDILIRTNVIESIASADLVIKPSVLDIDSLQFQNIPDIIDRGYQAAEAQASNLMPFSVTEMEWQAYLEARKARTRQWGFTPQFIEVTGSSSSDQKSIEKTFDRFEGRPLDRHPLESDLTRLTGIGPYEAARYRKVERNGQTGMQIELTRKTHGPPFIRPLFVLDSGQGGNASFTAGARISAFDFPFSQSELRTDLSAGRVNSAGMEYYQFTGAGGLFVAPRGYASQEQQLLVDNGTKLADYRLIRVGGGLDVGYNFGSSSEVRTGIEINDVRADVQIGQPNFPSVRGTEQLWTSRWRLNALNSGSVPTQGVFINVELDWQFKSPRVTVAGTALPAARNFGQARAQAFYAQPMGNTWLGLVRIFGGGTFHGEVQPFSELRLGGPLRLGALEVGELRGAHAAFGSAGLLRKFDSLSNPVFGKLYGALLYEVGDAFDSRPSWFNSSTLGLMAETKLGILFTGYSYGEQGRGGFFFSLGRVFDPSISSTSILK